MIIYTLLYAIAFFALRNYNSVTCELLPRDIVEDGQKNPIFGSYAFNPLTNTFEEKQRDNMQLYTATESGTKTTIIITKGTTVTSGSNTTNNATTVASRRRYRIVRRRRIPNPKYNVINTE